MRLRSYSLALAGLCAVILGIGGLSFWSAKKTSDAAAQSARATRLADSFEQARFAVGAEESLERKYRLEPGPDVGRRYDSAAAAFVRALKEARSRGSAADIELVDRLLGEQRLYLQSIKAMFAAVDAHQTELVLAIDANRSEPAFASIEAQVEKAAEAHSAVADAEL